MAEQVIELHSMIEQRMRRSSGMCCMKQFFPVYCSHEGFAFSVGGEGGEALAAYLGL